MDEGFKKSTDKLKEAFHIYNQYTPKDYSLYPLIKEIVDFLIGDEIIEDPKKSDFISVVQFCDNYINYGSGVLYDYIRYNKEKLEDAGCLSKILSDKITNKVNRRMLAIHPEKFIEFLKMQDDAISKKLLSKLVSPDEGGKFVQYTMPGF